MSTKHTPGPWHRNIKPARKYCVVFAGRNTHVAQICGSGLTDEEVEANCDLIAAAPELLAAGKALADEMRTILDYEDDADAQAALDAFDVAAAKAEGNPS